MALLPLGAWADGFGTEATVSTTTMWTFDDLTATTQYSTYTEINGLYLRTNQTGRSFTVTNGDETQVLFSDGYKEAVSKYLYVNNSCTYTGDNALTATSTAGDATDKGKGMIAINATVAGTFYVKIKGGTSNKTIRVYFADGTTLVGSASTSITSDGKIQEISYTSSGAGSFFVGGLDTGTSEIYAARFVPTTKYGTEYIVRNETTWTFNDYSDGTISAENTAFPHTNGLYARSISSRYFTIGSTTSTLLTFSDGYKVTVSKKATGNTATPNNSNDTNTFTGSAGTAATASNYYTPAFAFNAEVAGTCYVYMKGANASNSTCRIYFVGYESTDALTQLTTGSTSSGDSSPLELKGTSSKKGTFYIVSFNQASEIYAVRFVPTSEKKDEWVYIGETGYATWGNTSGKDIESLPTGLTAYKATAASDSHSVTLTSLDKMRRNQGYVISGTPNTNYGLTYGGTDLTETYNGGDMVYVSDDMENFAATNGKTGDALRNRYILGNDNGTAKFFTPSGSGTLKKGKAYLQTKKTLTPPQGARGIDINFEAGTTGINKVETVKVEDGKWYTLQGIEVKAPTKGLYIRNGKKVIVK